MMTNNDLKRKLLKERDFINEILESNKNPLTLKELTAERKSFYKGQMKIIESVLQDLKTTGKSDAITLNIDYEEAEKISILIFNLFIQNFFDLDQALDKDFISFSDLLKIKDLAIYLKGEIDEGLNEGL